MKLLTLYRAAAAALLILGTSGMLATAACSGDDNSTPDSGAPKKDAGKPEKDSGSHKEKDTGAPLDAGSDSDAADSESDATDAESGATDSAGGSDSHFGKCVPDASAHCNACLGAADAADVLVQLNACSAAVGNCIPFTGTVPANAP
jgi:hypothetical protein